MNTQDTGGPAFPLSTDAIFDNEGMTLRDYFAAKAMNGFARQMVGYEQDANIVNFAAKRAYAVADAMLKARSA